MKYRTFLFALFILNTVPLFLHAQATEIDRNFNIWLSNTNKYYLTPKTYAITDVHIRRANGLKKLAGTDLRLFISLTLPIMERALLV